MNSHVSHKLSLSPSVFLQLYSNSSNSGSHSPSLVLTALSFHSCPLYLDLPFSIIFFSSFLSFQHSTLKAQIRLNKATEDAVTGEEGYPETADYQRLSWTSLMKPPSVSPWCCCLCADLVLLPLRLLLESPSIHCGSVSHISNSFSMAVFITYKFH